MPYAGISPVGVYLFGDGNMATSEGLIITREIELQTALPGRQAILQDVMAQVPGIREVVLQADDRHARVTYDLAWLGFAEVADALANAGYPLSGSVWMRAKSSWYARQDRKARVVGGLPESACCGQPPDLSGEQHR